MTGGTEVGEKLVVFGVERSVTPLGADDQAIVAGKWRIVDLGLRADARAHGCSVTLLGVTKAWSECERADRIEIAILSRCRAGESRSSDVALAIEREGVRLFVRMIESEEL